jgi:signal peptidase I
MKKVAGVFGYMVMVLLMVTAALTFLAPHFGWRVDVVLSGSMEPEIHAGGLVVTRPAAAETIVPGDIITFHAPVTRMLTTHRVVGVEPGPPPSFHTRGDANEEADIVTVAAPDVVGEVCFDIPYVGYITRFVKTPLGLIISLCLPGIVIIISEMRNIRRALADREIV